MDLVTVVVPTYNRERLLGRALRSLVQQTYENIEVIVVDDGGSDRSADVVRAFDDHRLHYVRQENRGAAAARNTAMAAAGGTYICFLDSDDEYLPRKIEHQVDRLTTADDDVVAVDCGTLDVSPGGTRQVPASLGGQDRDGLLRFGNEAGMTPTLLCRTDAVGHLRWDEALPAYQDYDFALSVTAQGRVLPDGEPLVRVHTHEHERLTNPAAHIAALTRLHDKHRDEIEGVPEIAALWHFKLARLHLRIGEHGRAAHQFRLAAAKSPTARRRFLATASRANGRLLPLVWPIYTKAAEARDPAKK